MLRIIKLRELSQDQMAEVSEWLRDQKIDVSKVSSLHEILEPNHIRDIHKFSKQQQLKLKKASWKNFSEMLKIQYQMKLHKKFIRKLAACSVGSAECLFFEFIQLKKEHRLAKIGRAEARREEALKKAEQAEQSEIPDNSSSEDDDAQTVILAHTLEEGNPMKSEEPNLAEKSEKFDDIKSVVVDGSGDGVLRPPMIAYARFEEILRVSKEKDSVLASYAKQLEEQLRDVLPIIEDQPQEDVKAADSAGIRQ